MYGVNVLVDWEKVIKNIDILDNDIWFWYFNILQTHFYISTIYYTKKYQISRY